MTIRFMISPDEKKFFWFVGSGLLKKKDFFVRGYHKMNTPTDLFRFHTFLFFQSYPPFFYFFFLYKLLILFKKKIKILIKKIKTCKNEREQYEFSFYDISDEKKFFFFLLYHKRILILISFVSTCFYFSIILFIFFL